MPIYEAATGSNNNDSGTYNKIVFFIKKTRFKPISGAKIPWIVYHT